MLGFTEAIARVASVAIAFRFRVVFESNHLLCLRFWVSTAAHPAFFEGKAIARRVLQELLCFACMHECDRLFDVSAKAC